MQMNANKRTQTQTIADFRLCEMGPKTQTNAHKRKQMQTHANKRNIEELHPLLRTPFTSSPRKTRRFTIAALGALTQIGKNRVTRGQNWGLGKWPKNHLSLFVRTDLKRFQKKQKRLVELILQLFFPGGGEVISRKQHKVFGVSRWSLSLEINPGILCSGIDNE